MKMNKKMKFRLVYDVITYLIFVIYCITSETRHLYGQITFIVLGLLLIFSGVIFGKPSKEYFLSLPKEVKKQSLISIICGIVFLIAYFLLARYTSTPKNVALIVKLVFVIIEFILLIPERKYYYKHYSL